jgi:hypothetical protein
MHQHKAHNIKEDFITREQKTGTHKKSRHTDQQKAWNTWTLSITDKSSNHHTLNNINWAMYTNPIRVSCHYTAASKCAAKRLQLQPPSLSLGLPAKNVQYHPGTNLDSLKFADEIFCWRCYSFGNMGSLKIHISPGLGNKLLTLRSKSEWNSKDRARHHHAFLNKIGGLQF